LVSGLGTTVRARHADRKTNKGHVGHVDQPRRGSTTRQLPDAIGIRSSITGGGGHVAQQRSGPIV